MEFAIRGNVTAGGATHPFRIAPLNHARRQRHPANPADGLSWSGLAWAEMPMARRTLPHFVAAFQHSVHSSSSLIVAVPSLLRLAPNVLRYRAASGSFHCRLVAVDCCTEIYCASPGDPVFHASPLNTIPYNALASTFLRRIQPRRRTAYGPQSRWTGLSRLGRTRPYEHALGLPSVAPLPVRRWRGNARGPPWLVVPAQSLTLTVDLRMVWCPRGPSLRTLAAISHLL
ncbi:hypothetical protein CCHR01_02875 [Colletotrichum chrysophilum]|uniref:Uncharacterized protein n=1 Tax=Colletotrichum chrysophilum TaxID=1836956 RepID=A0AAD9AW65_9PEZI|nr:hypothetical protein CCHR01_02875 [Colletotrichum chrysophilum]